MRGVLTMPVPVPPSPVEDGPGLFTVLGAVVTATSSLLGVLAGAIAVVWNRARSETRMSVDVEKNSKEIEQIKADFRAEKDKGAERHLDNLEMIGELSRKIAGMPDKHDFQRLEDQILGRLNSSEQQISLRLGEVKQQIAAGVSRFP